MAHTININVPHFIGKAWVWIRCQVEGKKAETSATAQVEALQQPVATLMTTAFGSKITALLTADATVTEEEAWSDFLPEANKVIAEVAAEIIPEPLRPEIVAFAEGAAPSLFSQVFSQVAKLFKPANTAAKA